MGRIILFVTVLIFLFSPFFLFSQELFWETPRPLVTKGSRFFQAAANGGVMGVAWQEFSNVNTERGTVRILFKMSTNGQNWGKEIQVGDVYPFYLNETPIFSLAINGKGDVLLAVSSGEKTLVVFRLRSQDTTFVPLAQISTDSALVAPRLYVKPDGRLLLFVNLEPAGAGSDLEPLAIFYTLSEDGKLWSPPRRLVDEENLRLNFLPAYAAFEGRDYVVFQTRIEGNYQLFLKQSLNGGASWSEARPITLFQEQTDQGKSTDFDNQRVFLIGLDDRLSLAWERRFQQGKPQIYYAELNRDGDLLGAAQQVTSGSHYCNNPQIIPYKGKIYLLWFDNRAGDDHVILGVKTGFAWKKTDLSLIPGSSTFERGVVNRGLFYVFWENIQGNRSGLYFLEPDFRVAAPLLTGVNFTPDGRYARDRFSVSWGLPRDSSGIEGFNYSVDRNPAGKVSHSFPTMMGMGERKHSFTVTEDGAWYFHVIAKDYAGNWSAPATLKVYRDTTPPGAVSFMGLETDAEGFVTSNSFKIAWQAPQEQELQGFRYQLQRVADFEKEDFSFTPPRVTHKTNTAQLLYSNLDNGFWALTVSAEDLAGNLGKPQTIFFKLDKYVPVTYITHIAVQQDELGSANITIDGRGFTEGGVIQEIILDRDGKAPWDYLYPLDTGAYQVVSDRLIDGPHLEDVEQGRYGLGLVHPLRGLYFSRIKVELAPSGVVKFGDYSGQSAPQWYVSSSKGFRISLDALFLWVSMGFLVMALFFSLVRIARIVTEARSFDMKLEALLSEETLPAPVKKERLDKMRRKGLGLRLKFTVVIMFLVLIVVLLVSLPLGVYMIETQDKSLAGGLKSEAEVLLESLAAGAKNFLPAAETNTISLGLLPLQRTAMADSLFVTITGRGRDNLEGYDYVWASDDKNITQKIGGGVLSFGRSRIHDDVSPKLRELANLVNQEARKSVSGLVDELDRLTAEALKLLTKNDQASLARLAAFQEKRREVETQFNLELARISNIIGSVPVFNSVHLDAGQKVYTFYKPIVYRSKGDTNYYKGAVRLGISTGRIAEQIDRSRNQLLLRTTVIALLAMLLGALGAILLATWTIIPIKKLVKGVKLIRDTEDKEKLKDHIIEIKTRDEIASLAAAVNQMTQGLVKAARANKDLVAGKEVQKMFIPLQKSETGEKLTTGSDKNEWSEFFGYYEGAKGVSGDYFDYLKLDDQHYALIKCDVAGKGVAAAIIMVEVATIFQSYFHGWTLEKPGLNLINLVKTINTLLEERGFKGRFAALIALIINIETGKGLFCNAGDNLVHLYSAEQGKMVQKVLPEAPAAGVFPTDLVDMQGGFKQIPLTLEKGDTLILATDGIEEAKRLFRDSNFKPITCDGQGLKEGEPHHNHQPGSRDEEFGIPRMYEVVNAVAGKQHYRLIKHHNPLGAEELVFDFSGCEDSAETEVMALIAVEKIFRIYADPAATADHKVLVDKKVDAFLQKHFKQYNNYFNHPVVSERLEEYLKFSHLKEDEQYDDLTVLAVKKLK